MYIIKNLYFDLCYLSKTQENFFFLQTQGQIHDTVSDVFTKASTLEDRVNKIENTLVSLQVSPLTLKTNWCLYKSANTQTFAWFDSLLTVSTELLINCTLYFAV